VDSEPAAMRASDGAVCLIVMALGVAAVPSPHEDVGFFVRCVCVQDCVLAVSCSLLHNVSVASVCDCEPGAASKCPLSARLGTRCSRHPSRFVLVLYPRVTTRASAM
jgi:hypothetical protein